jgi:hypothetical protein
MNALLGLTLRCGRFAAGRLSLLNRLNPSTSLVVDLQVVTPRERARARDRTPHGVQFSLQQCAMQTRPMKCATKAQRHHQAENTWMTSKTHAAIMQAANPTPTSPTTTAVSKRSRLRLSK